MKHIKHITLLCVLFGLTCAAPLLAQMDGPPRGEGPRMERFEQLRRMKMVEALDLDEEQAVRLTVREKEFRETEREREKSRRVLHKKLKSTLDDAGGDEAIQSVMMQLNDAHQAMLTARHDYLLSLQDFLSMEQIAKLVLFERKFTEEIKRLLSKSGKRPPRH